MAKKKDRIKGKKVTNVQLKCRSTLHVNSIYKRYIQNINTKYIIKKKQIKGIKVCFNWTLTKFVYYSNNTREKYRNEIKIFIH